MARFTHPANDGTGISAVLPFHGTFLSLVSQTADGVNTPTLIKFEETYLSQGVTITNNTLGKPTRITFENAGVYNIQFSAQLYNTGGGGSSSAVNIWLKYKEANADYSNTKVAVNANSPYVVAAWNWFVPVEAGDYWQLAWDTNHAGNTIYASVPNGIHPGIPSIILTVNQIS